MFIGGMCKFETDGIDIGMEKVGVIKVLQLVDKWLTITHLLQVFLGALAFGV